MTPIVVGLIGIAFLILFLFAGMPVALVMGVVGFAGFAYLGGLDAALGVLATVPYRTFANYDLSTIPLFIFMGALAFSSGLSRDLYDGFYRWLGHFRGGLAMATVAACAGFGAVCGSSLACAVTMGSVALPEMKRYAYDPRLATGCIAAGGTLASMIPPSTSFIIYGIITGQSIGRLFIAGILPGILQALTYIAAIFVLCQINPQMGSPGPKTTFTEKIVSLKNLWIVAALFLLVMGGLYTGIFTATEAGGIGAFGAFAFGIARRKLGLQGFKRSLIDTGKSTAMIFFIIMGTMIFGYFLAVSRLPFELAGWISELEISRYAVLVIVVIFYIFLGCLMDALAMILITIPIFYPLMMQLGFDPIWFGVIIVLMAEIGVITPPVGINVYVIAGIATDVPMATVFRGIFPFFIADLAVVFLVIAFPLIATVLPNLMN